MSAIKTTAAAESADGLIITGLAVPFGGTDLDGESFGPETDLCLSWFEGPLPLLFQHGRDSTIKADVVGRVVDRWIDDEGLWVRAMLDRRSRWIERIKTLMRKGALGFSSGAMAHLVETAANGRIKVWPICELSLSPTPASPRTTAYTVKSALAFDHLRQVGTAIPAALTGRTISESELRSLVEGDRLVRSAREAGLLDEGSIDVGLERELARLRRAGVL